MKKFHPIHDINNLLTNTWYAPKFPKFPASQSWVLKVSVWSKGASVRPWTRNPYCKLLFKFRGGVKNHPLFADMSANLGLLPRLLPISIFFSAILGVFRRKINQQLLFANICWQRGRLIINVPSEVSIAKSRCFFIPSLLKPL